MAATITAVNLLKAGGNSTLFLRRSYQAQSRLSNCNLKVNAIGYVDPVRRISIPLAVNRPNGNTTKLFCTSSSSVQDTVVPVSPTNEQSRSPSPENESEERENAIKNAANTLELRVGRILKAWRHEEADSLYVEEVDVGEPEPRIICSGLVKYIPLEFLQDKMVVVLANLKPRNMRGVKSFGMLMAASDASHETVELLEPPEGSSPGERIWFGSSDEKENLPEVVTANQVHKKKIWEQVQPHLKTDSSSIAMLGEHSMRTSTGVVVCKSLKNANIS
ncbi:tyrosine--tRNA ligase, cytoplasmic-like [Impatiens glandulifera]|uniref:tyrosine--tRNA ligase, cytoplasmic-like n=1 Tax=Impatiens glandulifera TaxID=253017 RepID=UPI001FB1296B|nr:tyrosine--tRNA ligase, cytoplasmic-like [Impatiens glandulifera]